jgi:hypothetical protein
MNNYKGVDFSKLIKQLLPSGSFVEYAKNPYELNITTLDVYHDNGKFIIFDSSSNQMTIVSDKMLVEMRNRFNTTTHKCYEINRDEDSDFAIGSIDDHRIRISLESKLDSNMIKHVYFDQHAEDDKIKQELIISMIKMYACASVMRAMR